ncbi:MAG: hypothetical protein EP297_02875 [Gammaproteobacteria bacterium]|nr:MAG: hypothetical protein EP297_02875 [Gammaproteobacteria bacterium]
MSDTSKSHTQPEQSDNEQQKRGTVMLVSGSLDHALTAFEIAIGMQAMGMQMTMWFVLYGVNSIKKPRSYFSFQRWFPFHRLTGKTGRNLRTDTGWQKVLLMVNHEGATNLPLSQLNFFGAGPWLFGKILKKKRMATLPDLIKSADQLGVKFRICQTCVDATACDVDADLVVKAEVAGVSRYTLDVMESHYNAVI